MSDAHVHVTEARTAGTERKERDWRTRSTLCVLPLCPAACQASWEQRDTAFGRSLVHGGERDRDTTSGDISKDLSCGGLVEQRAADEPA
jgi:hypothetical protein